MTRSVTALLFVFLSGACLAVAATGNPTCAALPLKAGEGVTQEDAGLFSQRFVEFLQHVPSYDVLDSSRVRGPLASVGFEQIDDCTSTDLAVEAGRILGVRHVVFGELARKENLYSMAISLVDCESGQLVRTAAADATGGLVQLAISGPPESITSLLELAVTPAAWRSVQMRPFRPRPPASRPKPARARQKAKPAAAIRKPAPAPAPREPEPAVAIQKPAPPPAEREAKPAAPIQKPAPTPPPREPEPAVAVQKPAPAPVKREAEPAAPVQKPAPPPARHEPQPELSWETPENPWRIGPIFGVFLPVTAVQETPDLTYDVGLTVQKGRWLVCVDYTGGDGRAEGGWDADGYLSGPGEFDYDMTALTIGYLFSQPYTDGFLYAASVGACYERVDFTSDPFESPLGIVVLGYESDTVVACGEVLLGLAWSQLELAARLRAFAGSDNVTGALSLTAGVRF